MTSDRFRFGCRHRCGFQIGWKSPSTGIQRSAVIGALAISLLAPHAIVGQEAIRFDSRMDSIGAALERQQLDVAREIAERAVEQRPRDARALMMLGRVHLEWPRIGRFRALGLFRRAARLAPGDPEPHYWIGRTGIALLGDDGEAIARRGLERVLELDPNYRDAWELWLRLYRSPEERARMARLLMPHADDPRVRGRLARLWVEDGRCDEADTLLARLERPSEDPRWPAWRAECAFQQGRADEGHRHYERAVARSPADSGHALWAQVTAISTPEERAAYLALAPEARPDFYGAFWGRRDPMLLTLENERLAEHFQRRAEARKRFRLLHPLSWYHHHADYRDFATGLSSEDQAEFARARLARGTTIARALETGPLVREATGRLRDAWPPTDRPMGLVDAVVTRELRRLEERWAEDQGKSDLQPDLAGLRPEILPLGRNLPESVDDRGLVFIRHGEPDRIEYGGLDVEEWTYFGEPNLRLRFQRGAEPPNPPVSEMIHRPVTSEGWRSVAHALTSDRSTLPAPLEFGFWFARFRHRVDGQATHLVIFPDLETRAGAALWDGTGREITRTTAGPGEAAELAGRPGLLWLGLDVERSDSLGRYRGAIELPDWEGDGPTVSDLVVAHALESPVDRRSAIRSALPGLRVREATPFTIYLEVYGLATEGGVARYEVVYEFERERGWLARLFSGSGSPALRFTRVVVAEESDLVAEYIGVEPGRIPTGEYTLTVRVRDLIAERSGAARSIRLVVD